MKTIPDQRFQCNVCQQRFTRIDHLKRHQLRHTGVKPYSCQFCADAFARCDILRDHFYNCPQRGDRPVPETAQRGRRRHACATCTSMKLRCDGGSPCNSCLKRNLQCDNTRAREQRGRSDSVVSAKPEAVERSLEHGSIKFLLNHGTESFTENMRLPPRSDHERPCPPAHNAAEESISPTTPYCFDGTNFPSGMHGDPFEVPFFDETFLNFLSGPFGLAQHPLQDPFSNVTAYSIGTPCEELNLPPPLPEPESPLTAAMIQSIMAKSWSLDLDHKRHEEISSHLHFLLKPSKIPHYIDLYFKCWHPNCPMIHRPSFDPEQVQMRLLVSVVFMGTMYSPDENERYAAKKIIDLAELYVYSSQVFSHEAEISRAFSGIQTPPDQQTDWEHFQNFQAGYLMLVTQYWAGSRLSRNRAMETRFSEVIKVARELGLTRSRHQLADRIHESLWIQKESRIRTMASIRLMDCAFSFFRNYPCRLTPAELQSDFPCEESVFSARHPFAEPKFCFSREFTISNIFEMLFAEQEPVIKNVYVLDMFLLIHLLCGFINTTLTTLVPIMRPHTPSSASAPQSASASASTSAPSSYPSPPDGPPSIISASAAPPTLPNHLDTTATIRRALSRWRTLWNQVRAHTSERELNATGFFKNAYNFWLVAQLLVSRKESLVVAMRMEGTCEDRLGLLRGLVGDEEDSKEGEEER